MSGDVARHEARGTRAGILFPLLAVAILVLVVVDLSFGSVRIPAVSVFKALAGQAEDPSWNAIIGVFRVPKTLTAAIAGAALAAAGLILQSVFRNPLAGPDSLGIGAGASIGVAVLMLATGPASSSLFGTLASAGYAALALAASLGAGVILAVILFLSRKFERGVTLLIVGLLIGYLTGSLVSLLVFFGTPQKVQLYLGWTYGSFSGVRMDQLPIFAGAAAAGLLLTLRSTKALNAFTVGESFAGTLGIKIKSERTKLLAAAAILSGSVTAFCGPIAFLGIAAPQAARRLFRSSDHRVLLPGTMLVGSVIALLADIVSQAPGGGAILPVNPLLALIGAPIILAMFVRGGSDRSQANSPGGEP
jgi:iron complex transport system permease protein